MPPSYNLSTQEQENMPARNHTAMLFAGMSLVLFLVGFSAGVRYEREGIATAQETNQGAFVVPIQKKTEPTNGTSTEQKKHDFNASARYIGSNTWEYSVTGSFPNLCPKYDLVVDITENEVRKKIATLKMVIYRPEDETLCGTSIKKVNETRTFQAGPNVEFVFEIIENSEIRNTPTSNPLPTKSD